MQVIEDCQQILNWPIAKVIESFSGMAISHWLSVILFDDYQEMPYISFDTGHLGKH